MEEGPNERTVLIQNGPHVQVDDLSEDEQEPSEPESVARYWKNHLVLCTSFLLAFTSYSAIQNLESSLNHLSGLGVSSLACLYGSGIFACLLAPAFVSKVGPKWGIASGLFGQVVFAASNFYPQFYTLIPASLILGVLGSAMWTGQGVYLTQLASDYADRTLDEPEHCISRFNGVFFSFFTGAQVVGNLVSSLVLFRDSNGDNSSVTNITQCGASFCAFNSSDEKISPPKHVVYTLMGIYTGCALLSFLLFSVFADNRPQATSETTQGARSLAIATIRAHRNVLMLLLVPLFLWAGVEQSFIFAEYTQAFVSCHLGIGHVGFAMISFGAADMIVSLIAGGLEKGTGRMPLFLFAFSTNIGLLITMLLWDPVTGNQKLIFVIPGLWGMTDAIWNTTVSALIGTVFADTQNSVFASFRMWQFMGFMLMFLVSPHVCMDVKTYVALVTCTVAMVLYVAMEIVKRKMATPAWLDLYEPIE